MDFPRPYPQPSGPASSLAPPLPIPGSGMPFTFTTMEGLVAHFSQWLPPQYVHNLIEAEKEIFVVRRDVSLQETRLQFLKKCEGAMSRIILDMQAGRTSLDWNHQAPRSD
jgi:hypothetical protein